MSDAFRALPAVREELEALEQRVQGRMARVAHSSPGGLVHVELPTAAMDGTLFWDGPLGPYVSTVPNIGPGTYGILLPLQGNTRLFIPTEPNAIPVTRQANPWFGNRYLGSYDVFGLQESVANQSYAANVTYGVLFIPPVDTTVDLMAISVAATPGGLMQLGIYEGFDGSGYATASPLTASASISTVAAGIKGVAIPAVTLKAGKMYWLSIVFNVVTSAASFVPASSPLALPSHGHRPILSIISSVGSFSLASPGSNFSTHLLNPAIQVRRQL